MTRAHAWRQRRFRTVTRARHERRNERTEPVPQRKMSHILRLIRYEGQSVWRSGGREDSEIMDSGAQPLAGNEWSECTCDPLRGIVEAVMLPSLSLVFSQEGMERWLLTVRKTSVCGCGRMYHHLWFEALSLAHRQRAALRRYIFRVYAARFPSREGSLQGCRAPG